MQTNLAAWIRDTPDGIEADAILRSCVHCGFCNATCPTYQLLGNELDGPRGRIYLIKQVLEGKPATASTQLHLDRCLTCRNCETTCPSGVQYGRLVDIGRGVVERQVTRPLAAQAARTALREGLTSQAFAPAMKLGQAFRGFLPPALRAKVPQPHPAGAWPRRRHARRMLLLAGCVQPSMQPNINAATARVLDQLGIEVVVAPGAGCCGALRHHLSDHAGALVEARRNIDAWWPELERGCTAIVNNASGCGAMVKDYGHLLRNDSRYAAKAARVSDLAVDLAEVVPAELPPARLAPLSARLAGTDPYGAGSVARRVAFHPPCTLQHAQKIHGAVEALLRAAGAEVVRFDEPHLCCGSAGTYSVLQPHLALQLRDRKLASIDAARPARPEAILSANIGCITHLQGGTQQPVLHWIEWLDRLFVAADGPA